MESLYLTGNKLSSLPESFGGLRALELLNLRDNDLSSLPESFGDLRALESLSLRDNRLGETYNQDTCEGRDPALLLGTLITRLMSPITPLHQLLGGLPLSWVSLGNNNLQPEVINAVRLALPNAYFQA